MAISYISGQTADSTSATSSLSVSFPSNTTVLPTLVVGIVLADASRSVLSVTDAAGNTYVSKGVSENTGVRTELWCVSQGNPNVGTVVASLDGSCLVSMTVVQYSGASVLPNASVASNMGDSTHPRVSVLLQHDDNLGVMVCGFACNSGDTIMTFQGTIRQSIIPSASSVGIAAVEALNALYASTSTPSDVVLNSGRVWSSVGLELDSDSGMATKYDGGMGTVFVGPYVTQLSSVVQSGSDAMFAYPLNEGDA